MNPANRSNSSQVTYISITSPHGEAKRICIPKQGEQPPPYGVPRKSLYRQYSALSSVIFSISKQLEIV